MKHIDEVKYPFNFSNLREGDKDPTLGKEVWALISSDDDYIVYLDEDGYVQWTMNDNKMLGRDSGPYLNMVGRLEAVNISYLGKKERDSYQRLIAEGVARLFEKDLLAAQGAFEFAEKWITARNGEVARFWYLGGASTVALLSALAALLVGFGAVRLNDLTPEGYNTLMGTLVGGLGAWLSVIQRSRSTELDVAAGPVRHCVEGALRITTGILGSFLVALAIRAGLILPGKDLSVIMVIGMVAGASERFVPSLIEQIESRAVSRNSKGNSVEILRQPQKNHPRSLDVLAQRARQTRSNDTV
jgi:hypothetical protein